MTLEVELGDMVGISIQTDAWANAIPDAIAAGEFDAAVHAGEVIGEVVRGTFPQGKGDLAESFLPPTMVDRGGRQVPVAASDLPYARIQDQGGDIEPTRAQYLTIPLTAEARSRRARDWPEGDLTFITSKQGNKLLVKIIGGQKKIDPQYLLRKRVTLKGTGYLEEAAERAAPGVGEIMADALENALEAAG